MDAQVKYFIGGALRIAAGLWLITFLYINSSHVCRTDIGLAPFSPRSGIACLAQSSLSDCAETDSQIAELRKVLAVHYFCLGDYTHANRQLDDCLTILDPCLDGEKRCEIYALKEALAAQRSSNYDRQLHSEDFANNDDERHCHGAVCQLKALNNTAVFDFLEGGWQRDWQARSTLRHLACTTIQKALKECMHENDLGGQANFLSEILSGNERILITDQYD
jgi:hypothetical protein